MAQALIDLRKLAKENRTNEVSAMMRVKGKTVRGSTVLIESLREANDLNQLLGDSKGLRKEARDAKKQKPRSVYMKNSYYNFNLLYWDEWK